jgi:hypothetical protein
MGRKGEGQYTVNQGPEWTRESHHDANEGFQVSKKGVQGRGQGFPSKGVVEGLGYALRYHANLVHIVPMPIVCMSC